MSCVTNFEKIGHYTCTCALYLGKVSDSLCYIKFKVCKTSLEQALSALAGIKPKFPCPLSALSRCLLYAGALTWQCSWYIAKMSSQGSCLLTPGSAHGRYYCTIHVCACVFFLSVFV